MTWLARMVEELVTEHGAVGALLYGSHAHGTARPASDLDLILLVPEGTARTRDARRVMGPAGVMIDLDVWLKPVTAAADDLLHLHGGRVVHDRDGLAQRLLDAVEARYARGPDAVAADELQALRVWSERMLARIAGRDDADPTVAAIARWRQAELLSQLIVDAYALRRWWYPGPGPALRELATRDPALHALYLKALAPDASLTTLAALVHHVIPQEA